MTVNTEQSIGFEKRLLQEPRGIPYRAGKFVPVKIEQTYSLIFTSTSRLLLK